MARAKKTKTSSRVEFFKYNPATDGEQTFNIDLALNENWDKTADELERLGNVIANVDVTKPIADHNTDPTAHEDIRNMVKNIDLSTVNNHTTAVGEDIKSHTTSLSGTITNHMTAVGTNINQHTTGTVGGVSTHVSNERAVIVNAVNSARDNVNATVVSQSNALKTGIKGDMWGRMPSWLSLSTTGLTCNIGSYVDIFNFSGSGLIHLRYAAVNWTGTGGEATLIIDGQNIGRMPQLTEGEAWYIPFTSSAICRVTATTTNLTNVRCSITGFMYR